MMADAPAPPARHKSQRIATAALAILLGGFGIWLGATFLPAIAWAVIISIAIEPVYARFEQRWPKLRTMWLPLIVTVLIAVLVLVPLAMGVVEAAREAKYLSLWVIDARENGLPEPMWLKNLPYSDQLAAWWQVNLATPEGTAHQLHRFDQSLIMEKSQLLGKDIFKRSVIFAFTLVALFFVLRDRATMARQFQRAAGRLFGPAGERVGIQIIRSIRGTIDGLVLVGIGEGAVMAVVYVIAGVPHPLLLGSLTAVAAMIPFGAAVLFAIASSLLIMAGSFGWAVAVFAIGLVVVGIADHFIRPVLIGGATRLPFLLVLVGILGGVESLGLLGLFVGPATMATLILLWRDYIDDGEINGSVPLSDRPAAPPPADRG